MTELQQKITQEMEVKTRKMGRSLRRSSSEGSTMIKKKPTAHVKREIGSKELQRLRDQKTIENEQMYNHKA